MAVTQNFSFTSTCSTSWNNSGNLVVSGQGQCTVTISASWDDNPSVAGDALGTISGAGISFGTGGESGSRSRTTGFLVTGTYPFSFGNPEPFLSVGPSCIQFRDGDGNDVNGTVCQGINSQRTFNWSQTASITFAPGGTFNGVSGDGGCTQANWSGSTNQGVVRIRSGGVTRANNVSSGSGSYTTCAGQSNANGVSPVCQQRCCTVRRTAFGQFWSVQECQTYCVNNDTNPAAFTVPTSATPGPALLTELEQNTTYVVNFGSVTGIDAPTQVRSPTPGMQIGRNFSSYTNGNLTVNSGDTVQIRFTSAPFNQSTTPNGTNGDGLALGQYNPASGFTTYTFEIGSGTANDVYTISTRTRRPIIEEDFDYGIAQGLFPFPDIDTETNNPTFYQSGAITTNDIEVSREIKASDPNVEVNVGGDGWTNVREL